MLVQTNPPLHLTYCTNIHPADGWDAVLANLQQIAPALKARLSPQAPFGLGLRLSAREAREVLVGNRLTDFRSFLDDEGLYVALINGFPHGSFHGTGVKTKVYAPDWRDDARVRYTLDLLAILARLLPDGLDGGISTVPLSYKPWMPAPSREDWDAITHNVARVAEALGRVEHDQGKVIHLDIEPEPDCLIETSSEAIAFFERQLRPNGAPRLVANLGVSRDEALELLQEHVRICFDCCHFAVEYEEAPAALERLREAGVRVGRVQLSSALHVDLLNDATQPAAIADRLRPFAESTYLHQVVEKRDGDLQRFPDLDVALDTVTTHRAPRQWRVHFHVPLFIGAYAGLGSTQGYVRTVLELIQRNHFTRHLEIETYTWDVLPPGLKLDVVDSIAREYEWVLGVLRDGHKVADTGH